MKMRALKSSMVAGYGYNEATKTLVVKFMRGGGTYHYADVPKEVAEGLGEAKSPGAYLAASIRGKYPHTKQQRRRKAA
jgi:hypothetical protein